MFWSRLKRLWTRYVENKISDIVRSHHALLQVFDSFSDPAVVIDRNYIIRRVNRATLTTLGKKTYQELLGKPCYKMLHGLNQPCTQCTASITFVSRGKTLQSGLIEVKANPGKTTTYDITCYPILDERGEVKFVVEYYRDSSDMLLVTRQLYESERARIMEPLAVGLAHQIRQPLTVVRAVAQYSLEAFAASSSVNNKDFQESMESIIQNVDTLNDVLIDLLQFSRPSQYELKKQSILQLLKQGLRLISMRAKEQKISIVQDWPKSLPDIHMDEKLLLQAYLNLLINALEAMCPGGQLTVRADYQQEASSPYIWITIEDTGHGVSKDTLKKLGQPFFSTKKGGIGLGLAITEKIIIGHGGKLSFDSKEHQGTKVLIELKPD